MEWNKIIAHQMLQLVGKGRSLSCIRATDLECNVRRTFSVVFSFSAYPSSGYIVNYT